MPECRSSVRIMSKRRRRRSKRLAGPSAWHFIGHLQSNKAKYAVRLFDMIHSLDGLSVAEELNRRADQAGQVIKVLIEVNLSEEVTKFGTEEEKVRSLAQKDLSISIISPWRGLMTDAPFF